MPDTVQFERAILCAVWQEVNDRLFLLELMYGRVGADIGGLLR